MPNETIQSLPKEIIKNIFSYLNDIDLYRSRLTNKLFYEFATWQLSNSSQTVYIYLFNYDSFFDDNTQLYDFTKIKKFLLIDELGVTGRCLLSRDDAVKLVNEHSWYKRYHNYAALELIIPKIILNKNNICEEEEHNKACADNPNMMRIINCGGQTRFYRFKKKTLDINDLYIKSMHIPFYEGKPVTWRHKFTSWEVYNNPEKLPVEQAFNPLENLLKPFDSSLLPKDHNSLATFLGEVQHRLAQSGNIFIKLRLLESAYRFIVTNKSKDNKFRPFADRNQDFSEWNIAGIKALKALYVSTLNQTISDKSLYKAAEVSTERTTLLNETASNPDKTKPKLLDFQCTRYSLFIKPVTKSHEAAETVITSIYPTARNNR